MWPTSRLLKPTWTRWSLWKRALLLFVGICITIQALFFWSMWREARRREHLKQGRYVLGPSPLPATLEAPLRKWVGPEKVNLLPPVVELTLNAPTDSDLASAADLSDLTTLEIQGGLLDAMGLKRLGALRKLTKLCLYKVNLEPKALSGLSDCARLSRIQIVGDITPGALEALQSCESLRELYLGEEDRRFLKPSTITSQHLAAIAKIPHLNELVISSGEISDTELQGIVTARELETLIVYELRLQIDGINILGRLPRLRQLQLEPIDKHYPYEPRPLKGFFALKAFSIANCRINSPFATSLAKLPKLEALSLGQCWVNDGLAGLAGSPRLKLLDLAMTDVNPECFRKIGTLKTLESLRLPGFEAFDEVKDVCPRLNTSQAFYRGEYFSQPQWPRRYSHNGGGMGGGFF